MFITNSMFELMKSAMMSIYFDVLDFILDHINVHIWYKSIRWLVL